jgi:hypothetical protein
MNPIKGHAPYGTKYNVAFGGDAIPTPQRGGTPPTPQQMMKTDELLIKSPQIQTKPNTPPLTKGSKKDDDSSRIIYSTNNQPFSNMSFYDVGALSLVKNALSMFSSKKPPPKK